MKTGFSTGLGLREKPDPTKTLIKLIELKCSFPLLARSLDSSTLLAELLKTAELEINPIPTWQSIWGWIGTLFPDFTQFETETPSSTFFLIGFWRQLMTRLPGILLTKECIPDSGSRRCPSERTPGRESCSQGPLPHGQLIKRNLKSSSSRYRSLSQIFEDFRFLGLNRLARTALRLII